MPVIERFFGYLGIAAVAIYTSIALMFTSDCAMIPVSLSRIALFAISILVIAAGVGLAAVTWREFCSWCASRFRP